MTLNPYGRSRNARFRSWPRAARLAVIICTGGALAGVTIASGAVAKPQEPSPAQRYVSARYELYKGIVRELPASRERINAWVARVSMECANILRDAPGGPQSTEFGLEELFALGEVFVSPDQHLGVVYANAVGKLVWTQRLTQLVRSQLERGRLEADRRPPDLCADLKAWANSGYRTVPEATLEIARRSTAENSHEAPRANSSSPGTIPNEAIWRALRPSEDDRARALVKSIVRLEAQVQRTEESAIEAATLVLTQRLGLTRSA